MKIPKVEDIAIHVTNMINALGIEPTEGMKETPQRVARMYLEMFKGLYTQPPKIKMFTAKEGYVCISNIHFNSMCEHHLLPFTGKCGVVYYSDGAKVVGLSKVARIVEYWSARPQLQERLTTQIAEDIMERLSPKGVYVVMSAEHSCMTMRGIKARGSKTSTAVMLGNIDKYEAKNLLEADGFFSS